MQLLGVFTVFFKTVNNEGWDGGTYWSVCEISSSTRIFRWYLLATKIPGVAQHHRFRLVTNLTYDIGNITYHFEMIY